MNKIDVPTGRRAGDGILQLQQFTAETISLTITHTNERVPALLLTKAQAVALRDALDGLIPGLEEKASPEMGTYVEGLERRRHAA
jgi:hypothetical protein